MGSTLDLTPQAPAWGVGSNAEPTAWMPLPAYTAAGSAFHRASRPDYFGWLEHVQAAAGCTRPIRLTGQLASVEQGTGRVLDARHTDHLPDGVIYKACGNRRARICPSCASTYQNDAYQLLRAGLIGGKGVPATVAGHPTLFLTLTAPSFGTVHTRAVRRHTCTNRTRCDCRPDPCHPRRADGPTAAACPHGQPQVCWARHEPGDPTLGRPLCLDCYDHHHQVVWNLHAGQLWHRTKHAAERYLRRLCRQRRIPFIPVASSGGTVRYLPPFRLSHGKVAELQRRGVVHFHALVRLDGVSPLDLDTVVPPPAGLDVDDLTAAIEHAVSTVALTTPYHPDRPHGWRITWGEQVDIATITTGGTGELTDGMAAGYLAKYATKSTKATGHTSTRITPDTVDLYADDHGDHTARLIAACWRLGRPTHTPPPLAGRPVTYPEPGDRRTPFDTPWTCGECGTRTRYPACPVCVARRQAELDSEPANRPRSTNPYAGLRRWAHMLGYGGHFLTKARRYSITFGLLRDTRVAFRRTPDRDQADTTTDGAVRLVDHLDPETPLIVGALTFAGVGWHTTGDALLANTAAAMARERRATAREELVHELATAHHTAPHP